MEQFVNQLVISILPIYLPIIILGISSAVFYKKIVGKAGEYHVKKELKKLPKEKYMILNDILIQSGNNTHQIDHIVVSEYGIFVIETKQWNGYITGNEFDKKWKQNNKHYINNPIHQNYGHIKALENLLHLDNNKFISIICIPSTAKLKVKSNSYVVRLYELNKTILSHKEKRLDKHYEVYKIIENSNILEKEKRNEHIKYAKQIKNSKETNNKNSCPKCSGTLVKKNGKYGKFIGCSNYPKCNFTKNSDAK